jgi:DNA-binding response OmpR family regulator
VSEERISLLVVDDEEAIRTLLARIGERAGFIVDTARDGVEALEMLRRKEYMIAIVDLMMPRLSGYELVQQISTLTPRPVVIVATALTNSAIASLDDSMVRRVIRKPFDIHAVAAGLIETARQIANAQTADASAPAEVITIAPADTAEASDGGITPPENSLMSAPDDHTPET